NFCLFLAIEKFSGGWGGPPVCCPPGGGPPADPIVFRHRCRDLTAADITNIQATILAHYARGRTYIGVQLCEQWDWRQTNGQYKAFAARDLLLRLERAGLVELPAPQRTKV